MKKVLGLRAWLALLLLWLLVLAGCQRWAVVTQAAPNPFVGQQVFAVEPVHFEGLVVGEKSEAEYLSTRESEQQAAWAEDKQAFAKRFGEELAGALPQVRFVAAPAPGFLIRPLVTFIEPGFYANSAARPTEVQMTLQILDSRGEVLDAVRLKATVAATMSNPSSGDRLRTASARLGEDVGAYLRTRVFP
jgi:hypothetical protein